MIPLKLENIINSKTVESQRIEYKKGWNPEEILHSICAFANDYDDIYGGYVIIGIIEEDGMPGEIIGVPKGSIDKMNRDVLNLVNTIEPKYEVFTDCQEYDGKNIFIIWAPGGSSRPYNCPMTLSEKKKSSRAHYIRKQSCTVRASNEQLRELARMSEVQSFDERVNYKSSMDDLDRNLMLEFLKRINSRMDTSNLSDLELARNLHITGGPPENQKPLNAGLLFFSREPERYFRYAQIEIENKPDPSGKRMTSKVFKGPLDRQIRDSMEYLENQVIEMMTIKKPGKVESSSFYNYPIEAVEETVVNAVLHKDYSINEPIRIEILPDRIEVLSIPGPNRNIPDKDIENGVMRSRSYRNRRIGEFLRELDLAEVKNTGIPMIRGSMSENGSPEPRFQTDADRSYMLVILPIHRDFLRDLRPPLKRRNKDESMNEILAKVTERGTISIKDLAEELGYVSVPSSLRKNIEILVASGSLEYTEKSLTSPKQKVRIKYD